MTKACLLKSKAVHEHRYLYLHSTPGAYDGSIPYHPGEDKDERFTTKITQQLLWAKLCSVLKIVLFWEEGLSYWHSNWRIKMHVFRRLFWTIPSTTALCNTNSVINYHLLQLREVNHLLSLAKRALDLKPEVSTAYVALTQQVIKDHNP